MQKVIKLLLRLSKAIFNLAARLEQKQMKPKSENEKRDMAWTEASRKAGMPIYMVMGYPILAAHKRHAIRKYKQLAREGRLNPNMPV